MNTTHQQLNEEDHYYDRLAQLQMCDSLDEKQKEKSLTLSNGDIVEIVP